MMARLNQIDLSRRCAAALIAAIVCAVMSVGVWVLQTDAAQSGRDIQEPPLKLFHISRLPGRSSPPETQPFLVMGEVAPQFGILELPGQSGFVIQSESGRGALGIILIPEADDYDRLVAQVKPSTSTQSQGLAVRLRPDFHRRASVLMRRAAPGRVVFVMEPVLTAPPIITEHEDANWPLRYGVLAVLFVGLFVVLRTVEVRNDVRRNRHLGEDQPWRAGVVPSSWARDDP